MGLELEWMIVYLCLGMIVGFMAGLLGIGGGGIMVPVLTALFLKQGVPVSQVIHLALGTSMASIILTSFASFRAHHAKQSVLWSVVKKMVLGIFIGTFLATFMVVHSSTIYLALFFSIFMIFVALQMFINKKPKPSRKLAGNWGLFSAGTIIGAVSALVSIGGGSLTVPYLTWQNIDIKKAIGTSSAIGFPIAISGTLGYLINSESIQISNMNTLGYIYFPAVLCISMTSILSAPLGVKLVHQLPVAMIKKIFAILLILLSLKMLLTIL